MPATLEQLSQIQLFASLSDEERQKLQPYTQVSFYHKGEIILHEGDDLAPRLYSLLRGSLQVTKIATTGKETVLRSLTKGEIFAAPALVGNQIAPATVTAQSDCEILTVERSVLLATIQEHPDIALQMLAVFNARLQELHNTVHGLVSERAIVRLARMILHFADQYGVEVNPKGQTLKMKLPYYRLARSIGISYEECVRLVKGLKSVLSYQRGGQIIILDRVELDAIAQGEHSENPN
ncbi:Crp/Fnr family transcriptional regulator [Oscillatoria salina]|uniref:Crp/Fnr family transcriptional regulator n=1 Tax=Oscillatoria salina TaxID=331517 RepID=UPI0013B9A9E2|nr:Crp/Fnr family transcriptional regulator [Oscillatoria salina]MBZ8179824.1 Crp/Fnr family transcriptional regulator [Oscillatoria salina IIICB1]NET88105.1 Crp/Fnr family transcriptional regulator [Kamptonema sp. SIO1D9]